MNFSSHSQEHQGSTNVQFWDNRVWTSKLEELRASLQCSSIMTAAQHFWEMDQGAPLDPVLVSAPAGLAWLQQRCPHLSYWSCCLLAKEAASEAVHLTWTSVELSIQVLCAGQLGEPKASSGEEIWSTFVSSGISPSTAEANFVVLHLECNLHSFDN